eukprot:CAMPEP_0115038706 /NCGR_PEP_ID=MMETSP0216-20121206/43573_1 /TAXON_ID=223996 /ORGANISM="Protocruzia adherens, Strain Boccale" /LENGTH=275 /DNA_ID=CAMNT_0002419167 /DNA_START=299 /DNA_END=1126 /DNA_ORIENTATION=+
MPSIDSILPVAANHLGPVKVQHCLGTSCDSQGLTLSPKNMDSTRTNTTSSSFASTNTTTSATKGISGITSVSRFYPSIKSRITEKAPFHDGEGATLPSGYRIENCRNQRVHSNILLDNATVVRGREVLQKRSRKNSIGSNHSSVSPKPRSLLTYSDMETKLFRSLQRSSEDIDLKVIDNSNLNCRIEYDLKKGEENDYFTDSSSKSTSRGSFQRKVQESAKILSDPSGVCLTEPIVSGGRAPQLRYKRNVHGSPIVVTHDKASSDRDVRSALGFY